MGQRLTVDYYNELARKIDYVTQHNSKAYYKATLRKVSLANPENATIICDYIKAEQTQLNIKESIKEGKIKVLIWLSGYFENKKSFREMTKQDILDYLNNLRKPVTEDPTHKWLDHKWIMVRLTKRICIFCQILAGSVNGKEKEKSSGKSS